MDLTSLRARFPDEPTDARSRALKAASDLFVARGYAGTSTDAIAQAAGIKPAALYRHFESKEHLLYLFLEGMYEGFRIDMLAAVGDARDPATRLARLAWAHTWVQLSITRIPRDQRDTVFLLGQLLSSLSEERADRLRTLARANHEHCRSIIADGVAQGAFDVPDTTTAALAITTMCEYTALWFRPDGALTGVEVADRYAIYALRTVNATIGDPAAFVARATGRPQPASAAPLA